MSLHRPSGEAPGDGELAARLLALDGAPYAAYRDLRGAYRCGSRSIELLSVQPDPFAPPSRLRVVIPLAETGLDPLILDPTRRLAAEDFFARLAHGWLLSRPEVGEIVRIDPPSQQILRRSALRIDAHRLEMLLSAELPGRGRRIDGRRASRAIAEGIPRMIDESLRAGSWDRAAFSRHAAALEDHRGLTQALARQGWVAFIADGSLLPRRSGDEDSPLANGIPFAVPEGLAAEVELPSAGRVRGMAIPKGITLLCGGGFHGKSTLLRAIAAAVYAHVPGDGRERIAADPTTTAVRAEDGRAVQGIDLSPFIARLPDGTEPHSFSTNNASGSTSQAAAIVEALEIGSRCLLIDEDTSATNFLLRDAWMARLLPEDLEPIRPLLSRLREIETRFGASTILVTGGSGEAFRVADRAVVMNAYRPEDATARMLELRGEMGPLPPAAEAFGERPRRSVDLPRMGPRPPRARAIAKRRLRLGRSEIDLSASGALLHPSQARLLAEILNAWLERGPRALALPRAAIEAAEEIASGGPAIVSSTRGDLAEVRAQEIAMMISRIRFDARGDKGDNAGTREGGGGYRSA